MNNSKIFSTNWIKLKRPANATHLRKRCDECDATIAFRRSYLWLLGLILPSPLVTSVTREGRRHVHFISISPRN